MLVALSIVHFLLHVKAFPYLNMSESKLLISNRYLTRSLVFSTSFSASAFAILVLFLTVPYTRVLSLA